MAITRSELRSRVLNRLDGDDVFYSESSRDMMIDHSLRIVNLFSGRMQTSAVVPGGSVSEQYEYDVPAGILLPTAVHFDGEPLKRSPLVSHSRAHPRWMNETNQSTRMDTACWIPIGITKFALWPADYYGGATITVFGIAEPSFTGADDEEFSIGEGDSEAVEEHASHILTAAEAGKVFYDSTVRIFRRSYQKKMQEIQAWQGEIMPFLKVELKVGPE